MKVALASPPYPKSLNEALYWVDKLTKEAAAKEAAIVCFPESYLPGYPILEFKAEKCTQEVLQQALDKVCTVAAENSIAVIMPMDWYIEGQLYNLAHVISAIGEVLGYQTKNQLDPSEDHVWVPGTERRVFEIDGLTFGVTICHEGFRYPESVRYMARMGAQIVFHPNLTGSNMEGPNLQEWGSKDNPYYEKAQMLRAMENTIYFASSNYATKYPESASALIAPDGTCVAWQPYREPGIIVGDVDTAKATGLLAGRFKPQLVYA